MRPGVITTIIPVYNRPTMLLDAVNSVLSQTWPHRELLIVDDGSTDDTRMIAARLAEQHPEIRLLCQDNAGPGIARNRGMDHATGEFIQFLDSDDLLVKTKFTNAMAAFDSKPRASIAYSSTDLEFDWDREPIRGFGKTANQDNRILPSFLTHRWWKTPSCVFRRTLIEKVGRQLPLITEEDWEFDCRIGALEPDLVFARETGSIVRIHDDPRLSVPDVADTRMWKCRATAHLSVFDRVRDRYLVPGSADASHFVRELFLLTRQCGAAGLPDDAQRLLNAAYEGALLLGEHSLDIQFYQLGARVLGFDRFGRICRSLDNQRTRWRQARERLGMSEVDA